MAADRWAGWTDRRPAFDGIHLDAAAAGRMSIGVQRAVTDHLDRESRAGAYVAEAEAGATLATGRSQLGALLGIPADGIAFVESATAALAALLTAWPLPEHPSVAVAASEWGANLRAFRMRGVEVRQLPVSSGGLIDIEALPQYLTHNPPTLVHVTQVAAHRGLIQPVPEILGSCRAAGVPVWVDAAQALGHIDPLSGADAVYATSRKWLCGPRGVGILGIAERWWDLLGIEALVLAPDVAVVARLESGEANIAGRVGLCVAVQEFLSEQPIDVYDRLAQVASTTRDALSSLTAWRPVASDAACGAIIALEPGAGQDVFAERQRLLAEHQILVTASQPARAPLELAGPTLRISPHVDFSVLQLQTLIRALSA